MAQIGDRVEATSPKPGRRSGVVTGVNGAMMTVRWDTGVESALIAAPGVLRVVGHQAPGGRRSGAKGKQR
jgi:hypothetical protein